jgi:hypothetical protein
MDGQLLQAMDLDFAARVTYSCSAVDSPGLVATEFGWTSHGSCKPCGCTLPICKPLIDEYRYTQVQSLLLFYMVI